ncbi:hypothetical protein [Peristeroidobacter agariperforans]|uniref:hypothetical protein n=1 Tax=Peristeroidobacter agariperforans TaxID=268404 RepID=UPI00101C8BC9|nr:hypothetical protein [Peristeroidobacter agariperforans]
MSISRSFIYPSLLAAAGTVAGSGAAASSQSGFVPALVANTRHESIPAEMDIYAPFLGDWNITGTEYREPGKATPVTMVVNFSRALEGRAIQDVWSWPLDSKLPIAGANRACGTTFRVYDPLQKIWHVTWIDPVKRARVQLAAKKVGSDIVQIGANDSDQPRRWTFTDITADSFTWRGEFSEDRGNTWHLNAEYFAKRR